MPIYIPEFYKVMTVHYVKMKVYVLLLLVGIATLADGNQLFTSRVWAVLVAGSKGWTNYRHQADVCHAYQTLVSKGISKERIITLMYDDIANNDYNPYKGQIFNGPGYKDVYKGVEIDYKGNDVTLETFRNVLLGNKPALANTGSGRVLESGDKDHVFINFVDHGGKGVLFFPNGTLFATDLMDIFKSMRNEKKFEILVMYVEACYAGSVFDNIIHEHDNIFVSTASAPDESSFAYYCENDIQTCLGDLYSVTWIERMEKLNYSESLFEQFDAVRTAVLQESHVNLYGDYSVGFFQFGLAFDQEDYENLNENRNGYEMKENYVDNRDVPVYLAYREIQQANNEEEKRIKQEKYDRIIQNRHFGDQLLFKIIYNFTDGNIELQKDLETKSYPLDENIFDCYKKIINEFQKDCFEIYKNTYFLKHMYKLANICVKKLDHDKAIKVIKSVCEGVNGSDMIII